MFQLLTYVPDTGIITSITTKGTCAGALHSFSFEMILKCQTAQTTGRFDPAPGTRYPSMRCWFLGGLVNQDALKKEPLYGDFLSYSVEKHLEGNARKEKKQHNDMLGLLATNRVLSHATCLSFAGGAIYLFARTLACLIQHKCLKHIQNTATNEIDFYFLQEFVTKLCESVTLPSWAFHPFTPALA